MGLRSFFGKISDMIPNEVSKLNSWNKYNPEPISRATIGSVAALDRFGETYSQPQGNLGDALSHSMSAFQGTSADPNLYSSKNSRFVSDPWLTAGNVGELLPGPGGEWNPQQLQTVMQYDDVNKATGGFGRSASALMGGGRGISPNLTMNRFVDGIGIYK